MSQDESENTNKQQLYKLVFFVPEDYKERVKNACFQAGGGKIGQYDCCAFELKGLGQFRPLSGATPFLGQQDQLEYVEEFRVEMVVEKKYLKNVIAKMRNAHPYEEPAFDVLKMEMNF